MTDQKPSTLLGLLAELRALYPHRRFGQLLSNVAGWADVELWDIEAEQLLAAAEHHLGELGAEGSNGPATNRHAPANPAS